MKRDLTKGGLSLTHNFFKSHRFNLIMELKRWLIFSLEIFAIVLIFYSLVDVGITGSVIGANTSSKLMGIIGIALMISLLFIEKYGLKKHIK